MAKVLTFPRERTARPEQRTRPDAAGFYTPAEAARLARVPGHRLAAWRREGIVFPTIHTIDIDGRESVGYSFESLVYLRLLRMLRGESVPLFKAVQTVKHLRDRLGPPSAQWDQARIFAQGGDVFVEFKDDWDVTSATRGGQRAAEMLFGEEFARFRDRADALLVPWRFQPTVEIDPEIRSGHPVVRGTTLRTSVLYALRQRRQSPRNIQTAYPHLTLSQIRGALAFEGFLDAEAA